MDNNRHAKLRQNPPKTPRIAHNGFLKSALIISVGGLVAKLLGAIYRIPLTNLIGSHGMGLYQLVFPPYILIMILANAGIPTAISRLVSEQNALNHFRSSREVFFRCLRLLAVFGLLGSLLMYFLATPLAVMQGNPEIAGAYKILAPSIIFITLTSAFRAYFQAHMNMLPVSASQVLEQASKMVIGLLLVRALLPNVVQAVYGAILATTISEFVALVVAFSAFLAKRKAYMPPLPPSNQAFAAAESSANSIRRGITAVCVPVLLGSFIMQLTQLIDSVLVVNLLTVPGATGLYGIWTGPVNSILGLPVTLAAGVAITALPSITRSFASQNRERLREKYNSAFKLTVVIALPSALGVAALARPIIRLLYSGLSPAEIDTAALLLICSAGTIVFISLLQTTVAALQAVGKPYVGVLTVVGGVCIKLLLNVVLLPVAGINIYAAAISETMCYLFAVTGDIIVLRKKLCLKIDFHGSLLRPLACSLVMAVVATAFAAFAPTFTATALGTLVAIGVCAVVYLAAVMLLRVFSAEELTMLARRKKGAKEPTNESNGGNEKQIGGAKEV